MAGEAVEVIHSSTPSRHWLRASPSPSRSV